MANAFSELPQAIDETTGYDQIRSDEVAFEGEDLKDDVALKILLQDVNVAETHFQSKTLSADFNLADDLFRAYVAPRNWPNTNIARSNIPMPVVMEAIETALLPQAHMAFFSDPKPFLLEAEGGTPAEAARGMGEVVCWSIDETGFEEEIRKMLKSSLLYGQCIGKYGWKKETRVERKYKRTGGVIGHFDSEHDISCPTFEHVDVRQVLVDPFHNNHDVRGAAYVIQQNFITADELIGLKEQGYKNVPSKAQLAVILAERAEATKDSLQTNKIQSWREYQPSLPTEARSSDPLKQPLEILEYWTDDRVITVLQRCIVIRNEENEFGEKPYFSCSFIDVLNSFWGMGVAKMLEGEQKLQTGVLNAYVDSLNLILNPAWLRKKGLGTTSQNVVVGPGRIVNEEELEPLKMESVSEEALTAIQASEARATRRVGANYGPEMPTQAMRTAEGVQAFTSGVQVRLQYFIENFASLVYIPAIRSFIQLAKDNLSEEQANKVIHSQSGAQYSGSDILDLYNGVYSVDVLSSTKLAQRRSMAQMVPLMMQMLGQPAVQQSMVGQGKKLDYVAFIEEVGDITGWPLEDLIVAATPQEQQQTMIAMNPQLGKAMADNQREDVKHKNAIEQIKEKGEVQASNLTLKHVMDEASQAKELTGGAVKASAQAAEPISNQPPQ